MAWRKSNITTGVFLVLIGILIGVILVLLQQNLTLRERVNVKYTEIKRSENDSTNQFEKVNYRSNRINFQDIAKAVTPTVVYIEASVPLKDADLPKDGKHDFGDDFWNRFLPKREVETVGSGVLISPNGYILTNNHVIENAENNEVTVTLYDKRTFTGRIIGSDSSTDLAVVKIDQKNLPSITVGNSDDLQVGDWVLAIGNPFRLRSTVTAGIVSALGRDVSIIDDQMGIEDFIQTDAAINRGNSGGALVNSNGNLVGINTAIATETGNYEGYGFAIPSNLAIKIAKDIIQYGKVKRAYLGVQLQPVGDKRSKELGLNHIEGVEIVNVAKNCSAYNAGIKPHDVVLAVNGMDVNEYNQLVARIAVLSPGDVVHLKIWRHHKILNKDITLGSYKSPSETKWVIGNNDNSLKIQPDNKKVFEYHSFDLGFTVVALADSKDFNKFNLVITEIKDGSEAQKRGLKKGYVILEVDNEPVNSISALKEVVSKGLSEHHKVLLKIEKSNGVTGYYELHQNH